MNNDQKSIKGSAGLEFLVIENKTKKEYQQSDLEGENLTVDLLEVEAEKLSSTIQISDSKNIREKVSVQYSLSAKKHGLKVTNKTI